MFRPLDVNHAEDVAHLQRVLEGAPAYSLRVRGHLPRPTDAADILAEFPPGKSAADKFLGGFWDKDQMVGCADICRGYPEAHIAYIGLLLFMEQFQGCGYGREVLAQIRDRAIAWGCRALRIAVMEKNSRALKFWRREGFRGLYRKPVPGYIGDALVMESPL